MDNETKEIGKQLAKLNDKIERLIALLKQGVEEVKSQNEDKPAIGSSGEFNSNNASEK